MLQGHLAALPLAVLLQLATVANHMAARAAVTGHSTAGAGSTQYKLNPKWWDELQRSLVPHVSAAATAMRPDAQGQQGGADNSAGQTQAIASSGVLLGSTDVLLLVSTAAAATRASAKLLPAFAEKLVEAVNCLSSSWSSQEVVQCVEDVVVMDLVMPLNHALLDKYTAAALATREPATKATAPGKKAASDLEAAAKLVQLSWLMARSRYSLDEAWLDRVCGAAQPHVDALPTQVLARLLWVLAKEGVSGTFISWVVSSCCRLVASACLSVPFY